MAGDTVTLGTAREPDPWGTNVTYAWRQTSGTSVTLSATDVAAPTFTAPRWWRTRPWSSSSR